MTKRKELQYLGPTVKVYKQSCQNKITKANTFKHNGWLVRRSRNIIYFYMGFNSPTTSNALIDQFFLFKVDQILAVNH